MAKRKLTTEDVLAWLGSDSSIEEAASILAEIANGDYKVSLFRAEVSDYNEID
jgi:hypothetical protein